MSTLDPNWVALAVGLVSSVITGAAWYGALRSWMARREERETQTREKLTDHEDRIRDLERDVRPLDFVR